MKGPAQLTHWPTWKQKCKHARARALTQTHTNTYKHTPTSLRSVLVCLEPKIMLMTLCLKAADHYVFLGSRSAALVCGLGKYCCPNAHRTKGFSLHAHTETHSLFWLSLWLTVVHLSKAPHPLLTKESRFLSLCFRTLLPLSTSGFLFVMESFVFLFILCSIFIYWCFVLCGSLLQYSLQCYQKLFKERFNLLSDLNLKWWNVIRYLKRYEFLVITLLCCLTTSLFLNT